MKSPIIFIIIILIIVIMGFGQVATPSYITRKALEDRIMELEKGLEQAKANLHAYEGAIADCKFWLEQLDKPVNPVPPELKPAVNIPATK
jgi:hypothetical protein